MYVTLFLLLSPQAPTHGLESKDGEQPARTRMVSVCRGKPSGFNRGHPASLGPKELGMARCWKGEQGHLGWEVEKEGRSEFLGGG